MAITEGLIAPLSFGDPSQSEIYVYNGIFFSKAEDSKDSFKVTFSVMKCVELDYCCVVLVTANVAFVVVSFFLMVFVFCYHCRSAMVMRLTRSPPAGNCRTSASSAR